MRAWHDGHPGHAPIVITLDLKDDLTDNGRGQGDIATLNQALRQSFGDALFVPADLPLSQWPTAEQLQGRVLVWCSRATAPRGAARSARCDLFSANSVVGIQSALCK